MHAPPKKLLGRFAAHGDCACDGIEQAVWDVRAGAAELDGGHRDDDPCISASTRRRCLHAHLFLGAAVSRSRFTREVAISRTASYWHATSSSKTMRVSVGRPEKPAWRDSPSPTITGAGTSYPRLVPVTAFRSVGPAHCRLAAFRLPLARLGAAHAKLAQRPGALVLSWLAGAPGRRDVPRVAAAARRLAAASCVGAGWYAPAARCAGFG